MILALVYKRIHGHGEGTNMSLCKGLMGGWVQTHIITIY